MKRMILVGVVCAFIAAPASADPFYMTFDAQDGGVAGYGTNTLISKFALAPGALVETFNNVTTPSSPISSAVGLDQTGWTWGSGAFPPENGRIVSGSTTQYAAPYSYLTGSQDSTPYAAIPEITTGPAPRQVGVSFGGAYNYLGLHWGSMDRFDGQWAQKIDLYTGGVGGTLVATIVSPHPGTGAWTDADTNKYVNIFLKDGLTFDSAVFQSNQYAFEFDNLAVAVVPVPGAVLLGFLGLGYAGMKLRKTV